MLAGLALGYLALDVQPVDLTLRAKSRRVADAPSIRAASSRSRGMARKKFRGRKIAKGSPKALRKRMRPRIVS